MQVMSENMKSDGAQKQYCCFLKVIGCWTPCLGGDKQITQPLDSGFPFGSWK